MTLTSSPPASSEKLQKVLADAGLGSRRSLEQWIEAGRVSVNGARAKLGARVIPSDIIRVDGRQIARPTSGPGRSHGTKIRVLRYHKPLGEVCSRSDPEGRRSVFDGLPNIAQGRWIAVGRLDINTSGILLFTNAGELAHRLMHPSAGIEREYAVRVLPSQSIADPTADPKHTSGDQYTRRDLRSEAPVSPALLKRLQTGMELEDGPARFERIIDVGGQGQNHWYHVVLKEGKNHEVRRLWEAAGFRVSRLIRVRYGPVELARALRPGRWEALTEREIAEILGCVGLTPPDNPSGPRRGHPSRTGKPHSGRGPRPKVGATTLKRTTTPRRRPRD
ncbi:MAG: rRNA pseudouridine synthase [Gammaproteobacteria bacterium]|nr:rRNA pseudouridine synthase [Gammaproteobacteria bacterium]NNJ84391.1 rRNA pseudouridine synthase [Gammaproteobacteria bacterium]